MPSVCRPSTGQGLAKYWPSLSLAKYWQSFSKVRVWPRIGSVLAKYWPSFCQVLAKHWPSFGQVFAKFWPSIGQVWAKFRPSFGQVLAKFLFAKPGGRIRVQALGFTVLASVSLGRPHTWPKLASHKLGQCFADTCPTRNLASLSFCALSINYGGVYVEPITRSNGSTQ